MKTSTKESGFIVSEQKTSSASVPPSLEKKQNEAKDIDVSINESVVQQLEEGEEAFIPLEVAREKLTRVVTEMKKMKANHIKVVKEITSNFKEISTAERGKFVTIVEELRSKAKEKLIQQKKEIESLQTTLQTQQAENENNKKAIEEVNAMKERLQILQDDLKKKDEQVAELEAAKEKILADAFSEKKRREMEDMEKQFEVEQVEKAKAAAPSPSSDNAGDADNKTGIASEEMEAILLKHRTEAEKDRKRFEAEKKRLKEELKELPTLRATIETVTSEREDVKKEVEKMKEYVKALELSVSASSATTAADGASGDATDADGNPTAPVQNILKERLDALSVELEALKGERDTLRQDLNTSQQASEAEKSNVTQLQTDLKRHRSKLKKVLVERDSLTTELASLKATVKSMEEQSANVATSPKNSTPENGVDNDSSSTAMAAAVVVGATTVSAAAVEADRERIAELENQIKVKDENIETLKGEVAALEEFKTQVTSGSGNEDGESPQMNALRAEVSMLNEKKTALEEWKASQLKESSEGDARIKELETTIESLKTQLAAAPKEKKVVETVKEEDPLVREELEARKKDLAALEKEMEIIRSENEQLRVLATKAVSGSGNGKKSSDKKAKRSTTTPSGAETAASAEAAAEAKEAEAKLVETEHKVETVKATVEEKQQSYEVAVKEKKRAASIYKKEAKALKVTMTELGLFKDGKKPKKSDLSGDVKEQYELVGKLKKEMAEQDKQAKSLEEELNQANETIAQMEQDAEEARKAHAKALKVATAAATTAAAAAAPGKGGEEEEEDDGSASDDNSGSSDGLAALEVITLRSRLESVTAQHERELQEKEEEMARLRDDLKEQIAKASEAAAAGALSSAQAEQAGEASAMVEELNNHITELKEERTELQEKVTSLEAQVEELMNDDSGSSTPASSPSDSKADKESAAAIASLKTKLKASVNNTEKLQTKLEEVKTAYKEGKAESKRLKSELEKSKLELAKLANAKPAADPEELKALKKALAEEKKATKKLTTEKEKLASKMEKGNASAEKKMQAEHEKELKDSERKFKQEIASVQTELGKKLETAEKQANKYETAYNEKKTELAETTARLTEVEKTYKALEQESAKKEAEFASVQERMAEGMEAIQKVDSLLQEQKQMSADLEEAKANLKEEQILRKALRNELEDLKGKIRVYCRARPMNSREKGINMGECLRFPDQYTIMLKKEERAMTGELLQVEKQYEFDHVFDPSLNGSQEDVFEETKGLAYSAMDGFNVCVFAYGQTGSGKTFTMAGVPDAPGLKPRFVQEVFDIAKKNAKSFSYKISCYIVEIYLDQLRDLFWMSENKKNPSAKAPTLQPMKDKAKGIMFIKNCIEKEFTDPQAMLDACDIAEQSRKVGSTKMNAGSSRSHLIFAIKIEKTDLTDGKKFIGKLSLVDLAGSESVGKTGADKQRLKEAQSINRSLSALSNVISKLASGSKDHIPYRSNMLTKVMEDSLGGNAKTLMFVNISPSLSEFNESNSSLKYAALVKTITNDATADLESKEIQRLKDIIKKLKSGQQVDDAGGDEDDDGGDDEPES